MKTVPVLWFDASPWIDGKSKPSLAPVDIRNPATSEVITGVSFADEGCVLQAISGAVIAQKEWSRTSAMDRGNVLKRVAAALVAQQDEIARLLTAEQGKPYGQSVAEVEYAASFFQWFGEEARRVCGRIAPHPDAHREFLIHHKPVGVAALITPWNFPLAQGAKKMAAALAAGCAVIWKPSELTPLTALSIAPLLRAAGLPDGTVQIVPGEGPLIGSTLAAHPAVRVLSVTGSTATGSKVMSAAAAGIKRVSLELGGNAPFIILPDADLNFVADQLARLKLFVSGQVCVTANRVFVPAQLEKQLTNLLSEKFACARVGNGLFPNIDAGPLIHARACSKVQQLVDDAVAQGARLAFENSSFNQDPTLAQGSFFPPTILTGVHDTMRVAREEIFGPVLPILTYKHLSEAVRRANDTPHGLAAYVYGTNLSDCRAVASQLDCGIVGVNEWRPLKAEIPFGGIKQSGIGAEGGQEGIREFLDTQVISMPIQIM
jgi:succinate-semialdehyde dehydrogenase/glutarate-semialdehyde dehydrogenase